MTEQEKEEFSSKITAEFEKVLHKTIESRAGWRSLKKNGESWPVFITRQITFDRIILIGLAVFALGRTVQQYDEKVTQAINAAAIITEQQRQTANELKILREQVAQQADQLQRASEQVKMFEDALRLTVQRTEFRSTVDQQILPRLNRMEVALGTK